MPNIFTLNPKERQKQGVVKQGNLAIANFIEINKSVIEDYYFW